MRDASRLGTQSAPSCEASGRSNLSPDQAASHETALKEFLSVSKTRFGRKTPRISSRPRAPFAFSWSVAGARLIFERSGFNLIALPGRDWAFLAEFGPPRPVGPETLADWLESPARENIALIRNDRFGPLFEALGLESARCYLETAIADERMRWAQRLQRLARRRRFNPLARE